MWTIHGCLQNFGTPWLRPRLLFLTFFMGFCSDRPCEWSTKFEVRSFTRSWDNRGYPKNWAVPGGLDTSTLPFLQNFQWAFISIGPVNVFAKFEVRSFTRSWDNRGYPKNLGSPWIRPRFLFSKIFNGLLFGLAPYMYPPNLKSIALSVPEIIGGTPKIWAVPGYAHAPFALKYLIGFYSDWPCTCTRQIWSP